MNDGRGNTALAEPEEIGTKWTPLTHFFDGPTVFEIKAQ
jgi:hypothetical protein